MSYYTQISDPGAEPVTSAEAKSWARIDDTASDSDIALMITAAVDLAEQILNRPIIERQYTLTLDCFPNFIQLDKLPVSSVDSITYLDTSGNQQTLSSSLYRASLGSKFIPARITPAYGQVWPQTYAVTDAVVVTFTAGYGAAASDVPETVKSGIKYLVADAFENREFRGPDQMHENPTAMAHFRAEVVPRGMA